MALKKAKTNKGYEAEYWRIIQVNCNADRNDAVATFALYKDKATRIADPTAVVDSYQIDLGEEFNDKVLSDDSKVKDKIKKSAYEVLKAKAIIEDAKEEGEEVQIDEALAFFADAIEA